MQLLEFSVLVWILIRHNEIACIMTIENRLVARHNVVKGFKANTKYEFAFA